MTAPVTTPVTTPCRSRGERGAGSMLVLVMVGILATVTLALGVVAGMVKAHRVAQSAADLGALAGASALARGFDACLAAEVQVAANGADLVSCEVRGADVLVRVSAPGPNWGEQWWHLDGLARAGPS